MTKKLLIGLVVCVVLSVIFLFGYQVNSLINKFDEIELANKNKRIELPMDSILLYGLDSNDTIQVDLNQDSLFLHFWATWCKPCVAELDSLNGIFSRSEPPQFYIISDEPYEKIDSFLEKMEFDNLMFYSMSYKIDDFGVEYLPTTLLKTDPDPRFRKIVGGGNIFPYLN